MSWPPLSVSVVIPTFNGRTLLQKHLPAVLAIEGIGEWIVVDDGSSDDTQAFVSKHFPLVKLVVLPKNVRFAQACNQGVKAAGGDIIVLLNSDVSPKPDILTHALPHFRDSSVFAVGMAEENVQGELSGRACGRFERGIVKHWRCEDQSQPSTLWVSGGSSIFRKKIWETLGGFDPLFYPAYMEDMDLCFRALQQGYGVVFEPEAQVFHEHETTNVKVFGKRSMQVDSFKNLFLFIWKNIYNPRLMRQHLLWLPYHLTITNSKTMGALGWGLLRALPFLPKIIRGRRGREQALKVGEDDIFAVFE